jgi:predicted transcriptional regulator
MEGNSAFSFVLSSSVRVDIAGLLATEPMATDELIDRLDASQSAVYTAVSDLERRRVLFEGDGGWELTGRGRLILDVIEQWESVESFLDADPAYWDTHRTDVLPEQFRRRLPELGEYEIVRSEPPNVRAHAREVVDLLESADSCDTAVPIYVPEYHEAFPDSPDSRLLFPPKVIDLWEESSQEKGDDMRSIERPTVRVRDMEFGFTAADEFVMLALPPCSGTTIESMLVGTDQSAVRWAGELYEFLWSEAEPLDSYRERNHL